MPASAFKNETIKELKHRPSLIKQHLNRMLVPLALMNSKRHIEARQYLKSSNNSHVPAIIKNYQLISTFKNYENSLKIDELLFHIHSLDVTPNPNDHPYRRKGYKTYYQDKNENFDLKDPTKWNKKNINVYHIIKKQQPKTVIDIGSATGWFSRLAESLGSKVTSIDIDEYCMDKLWKDANAFNLNIEPMVLAFQEIDELQLKQADLVLCLSLIHHLIVVQGMEIENVFKTLQKITKRVLILEYVFLPDFTFGGFKDKKSYKTSLTRYKNYATKYNNLDNLLKIGKRYFRKVEILDSYPEKRKLLIFSK
jgi:SAM-dependent methyltransferase